MKNNYLQKIGLTTIGYQFRYNKAIKIERNKTSQKEIRVATTTANAEKARKEML